MPISKNDMFPSSPAENTEILRNIVGMKNTKVRSDEELDERIDQFFEYCIQNGIRPGVEAMALACGTCRQRIWDWETGRKTLGGRTADIIQNAKQRLATFHEALMLTGKINPVTGIFLAKNNFGYRDSIEFVPIQNQTLGEQLTPDEIAKRVVLPDPDAPIDVEYEE